MPKNSCTPKFGELLPPDIVNRGANALLKRSARRACGFRDTLRGWMDHSEFLPLFDDQGKVVRLAIFGRDITNETLLEQQAHQAQKMQALGG